MQKSTFEPPVVKSHSGEKSVIDIFKVGLACGELV